MVSSDYLSELIAARSTRSKRRAARRIAPQLTEAPDAIAAHAKGIVERNYATADEAHLLATLLGEHVRGQPQPDDDGEAVAMIVALAG